MPDYAVDPEIAAMIPPQTQDEVDALERDLLAHGCLHELIVWREAGCYLDGHTRKRICEQHGIPYRVRELSFPDRETALDWVDAFQLSRRNLSPDQKTLLLGRRYLRAKQAKGGFRAKGHNAPRTSAAIAAEHGVHERSVRRAGEFAAAVDAVSAIDPEIRRKVARGCSPPAKAIVRAAELLADHPEQAAAILVGQAKTSDVIRELRRDQVRAKLEDISSREVKAAAGLYDVIVIDPPWPMQKIERDCRPRHVALDYPTMSEDELSALAIPCADDCHVWLWTTHKFLLMALRLLERWQLRYTCCFCWHKDNGFQPFGLPKYNCEFALYARRGSPEFLDAKAFNACFNGASGKHSEKPGEFYDLVRRVTAGRRLDMFNRREIEGFDRWGKEA